MPGQELFRYQLTITGRLRGESRPEVEAAIRAGLSMTLPIHESIDSLVINAKSESEDLRQELRRRFPEQPERKDP